MTEKMVRKDTGEEISQEIVQVLKERFDYTEEQIKNLSPTQWTWIDTIDKKKQYRIIMEVVRAKNCACKPKKGDRFVFAANGMLLPQESTFPVMCLWALHTAFPFLLSITERIVAGLDPSPVGWNMARCSDVGYENGGFGEVVFRIYCEKSAGYAATPLTEVI